MTDQSQTGGMGSTNTQIGHISMGMSYSDVRDIAKDVFRDNFLLLKGDAKEAMETRVAELRDAIIERLKEENIHELAGFAHPEKQSALFDAQKGFALSGDGDLKTMLVDTIAKLAREPERSLKSIVLQEAIKTMPSLTRRQVNAIALSFMLRSVGFHGAGTLEAVIKNYELGVGGPTADIEVSGGDFRHLEFTRCGVVEITELSFMPLLRDLYPGLVSVGMSEDLVHERFGAIAIPTGGLMRSLWQPGNWQIAAVNQTVLDEKSKSGGWTSEQEAILLEILRSYPMDDTAMRTALIDISAFASRLLEVWDNTSLKSMKLTSVGIAIAHSHCSSNGLSLPDLEIWI